jgi:CubicO group peptidase (beta-lactamase class C family)
MSSSAQRLLFISIVIIAAHARATDVHAVPPDEATLRSRVDAIAGESLTEPGAAGLSIGLARNGSIVVAKGYGWADLEFDAPADSQTMFRIGSVTKQFTAAAIMRLIEQGKLSLDDNLHKHLPEYPTQGHAVTIRNLLNHTSGIKSYTDLVDEWERVQPLELAHDELLALVRDKAFDFAPGEKWHYNNTAYYMLGMIIENVGGGSYGEFMSKDVFTPLQLQRTRCDSNSDLIKNRAQGYRLLKGKVVNDRPLGMSQPGAAGALLSTGEDLVKWSMALTSGGVVTPESFTLMTTPTVLPDGQDTHYGFGLAIDEFEGHRRIQHGGGIFGFNSMLLWLPDVDLHIAVISNGEAVASTRIADRIARAALGIESPQ